MMVKLSINFVGILPQTPSKGHNTIQRQRDTWYTVGHSAPIVSTSGKSDFGTKEYCNLKTGKNGREGYTKTAYEYIHYFSSFLFFHAGNDSHKVLLQNKEKNFEGIFFAFGEERWREKLFSVDPETFQWEAILPLFRQC